MTVFGRRATTPRLAIGPRATWVRPAAILVAAVAIALVTRLPGLVAGPSGAGAAGSGLGPVSVVGDGTDAGAPVSPTGILDAAIATWSQKVGWDANDYISATTLGGLYLQRARLTADLGDYQRARTAADVAIAADPGYESASGLKASVLFAIHDFRGALAIAQRLLVQDPANLQALAIAADATLELGDLTGARNLYTRLTSKISGPAIDARLAHFAYLRGDAIAALERARAARDAALRDQSGTDAGFYDYQLGETARLVGDTGTARDAYAAAVAIRSTDFASLVGLARIDAYEGHIAEAIAGLRHAAAIAPQPETLALLGDLLAMTGNTAGADAQYATVRTIARLDALVGSVYDRQLLLFELDHEGASPAILERATAALVARPDAPGHDAVAWAAYRLGRYDVAAKESGIAMASGIMDARILFHAGAIDLATGHAARGRSRVEEALALGPALDPLSRAEAMRLVDR